MRSASVRTVLLPLATLLLGAGAGVTGSRALADGPTAFTPYGFTFELQTEVPVSPEAAFDAFTGDVSGWWDHHFSEHPKSLVIEPRPGGSFLEVFDEGGNGAEHARVTHAVRGQLLRMSGPLGLVGQGVETESMLQFAATDAGCRVTLRVNGIGKADAKLAAVVEQVWRHFLIERYTAHVRGG
ncbi:MAG: SRPBCC domain-containing protein [Planctomycetes bacterium]|nr:SRPBCC domain-containing protein [Planctomycetota bacterium]